MKAKIYRGTREVGGTCVELKADNGKILWIDLGAPLDGTNTNIDYAQNKVDALLISHPHQDHFGLMEKVGTVVPIYIGQVSLDLINATRIFRDLEILNGNFIKIKSWESFIVADTFRIKPFLVDHSTPEAFAFLIEADGKRIFYSGDFRATGRKNIVYQKLIENPPENIDLLLMEGTMIGRSNHLYLSEDSVEKAIFNVIKDQKNLTFVISSAQNIDRFVSTYRACRRSEKYLVIDVYSAWVLEMVRKQSKNIPAIEWEEIKVYAHPSQLEKVKDTAFDEFRERIKPQCVGNSVFESPSNFVYFVRCPNEKLANKLRAKGTINLIYSQWEGYLREEHKNYCKDRINTMKNWNNISFHNIHASGHATVVDLMNFAKAINPKEIVPIHTSNPKEFKNTFEKEGFSNIRQWDDGKEYHL
jgi:ribonuclease J